MWTDLIFNLGLLAIAAADATSFFFILAVSNCCYIIFNFLNLNSGWIHRIDNGHIERPWKAPTLPAGAGCAVRIRQRRVPGRWRQGLESCGALGGVDRGGLIIPVFLFRHYVQDGGFPPNMLADLNLTGAEPSACGRRVCCLT